MLSFNRVLLSRAAGKIMGNGIFAKSNTLSHFIALALVFSIAFIFAGNFLSLAILAVFEVLGNSIEQSAYFVTIPIACAVISAGFVVKERRDAEREANNKVHLMMRSLRSYEKLTDEEIEAFYEGMRSLTLNEEHHGSQGYGRGYGD